MDSWSIWLNEIINDSPIIYLLSVNDFNPIILSTFAQDYQPHLEISNNSTNCMNY